MIGVDVPAWSYTAVAGMDLVRGADGLLWVLEDNLRTPSGITYASAARAAVDAALPGQPPAARRSLAPAYEALGAALREAAPEGDGEPYVVLLSDGPSNSAWYEHRQLAQRLGLPLVTPDDLYPSRGALRAMVDGQSHEVDVVYRRTDEDRLQDDQGRATWVAEVLLDPCRLRPAGVRERLRQRRDRRQARARLRGGDDPLLPGRGAADPVRAHLRPGHSLRPRQHPCAHRRGGCEAEGRPRGLRHRGRAACAPGGPRARGRARARGSRELGSTGNRDALPAPDGGRRGPGAAARGPAGLRRDAPATTSRWRRAVSRASAATPARSW